MILRGRDRRFEVQSDLFGCARPGARHWTAAARDALRQAPGGCRPGARRVPRVVLVGSDARAGANREPSHRPCRRRVVLERAPVNLLLDTQPGWSLRPGGCAACRGALAGDGNRRWLSPISVSEAHLLIERRRVRWSARASRSRGPGQGPGEEHPTVEVAGESGAREQASRPGRSLPGCHRPGLRLDVGHRRSAALRHTRPSGPQEHAPHLRQSP